MRAVLVLVLVLLSSVALADSFQGWSFTAPTNYQRAEQRTFVRFEQIAGGTYCQLALYAPRAMTSTLENEAASEWKTTVEASFTVTAGKRGPTKQTKAGIEHATMSGAAQDKAGNKFVLAHTVIATAKHVSSLLVTSGTDATLANCAPAMATILDSLTLERAPISTTTSSPIGRWANSASAQGPPGSIDREYTFAADGTYTFRREVRTQRLAWILADERGTWTLAVDKLTVVPTSSTFVERTDKTIQKKSSGPLEKMTYAVSWQFFQALGETQLVLRPTAKTARDGEFSGNEEFKGSYLYSNRYKPAWRF